MHSLLEERWELDLIQIAYWEVNLRAVRLQLQRQDGEFEEKIRREGEEGYEWEVGQQWTGASSTCIG